MKIRLGVLFLFIICFLAACGQDVAQEGEGSSSEEDDSLTIGLSVADLTLERWQHDRDIFVKKAKELGADEVIVQSADGDEAEQNSQVETMLTQGVDVMVIIPDNSDSIGSAASMAEEQGVPVIAYDRMINNADIETYVSFDNERVGEMQAEYLLEEVPQGNYFLMGGAPTDSNAQVFRNGQMNVLQPEIDSGNIQVVGDQWVDDWSAANALSIMENALTANDNNIDAVVASNDSTAGGAIQALKAQGLAEETAVSGQDADLAAVQRIVEGTQTMTVYKPITNIATRAAEVAVKVANGEEYETDTQVNNGEYDIPSILLDPIAVNEDNMVETVIADGFHSFEEVYTNVPEEERPERPQ
ncbi:D-xylose ABC transporter substrate-binding protein [Salibacterium halotolerans]|uniref:D-xylose-binding periplasmic protein n=1 Tax=Salibacterium halotolerans TaxID=1884432 RepID=A0A1I5L2G8_9BACI|nr:D-xylose ABC transporter substrate-binding protein [Salibacterium halotolerans]SFO91519.1 D-xylose transport system substrate-binding protein [Salibacterium halotolerans]